MRMAVRTTCPNIPEFPDLRRVNITIEGELHTDSVKRARELGLHDGFSGLVARLLKKHLSTKGSRDAKISRRYSSNRLRKNRGDFKS